MRVSSETLSTRGRAGPGSQVSSVRALYLLLIWKRRMPSPYLLWAPSRGCRLKTTMTEREIEGHSVEC